MFDSDSPFPQAIPALADCYEAAAAGHLRLCWLLQGHCKFSRGRCDAPPQFLKRPAWSLIAAPQIFLLAGVICRLPVHTLSSGRRDLWLPRRHVSVGRRDTRLLRHDFSFGRQDPPFAIWLLPSRAEAIRCHRAKTSLPLNCAYGVISAEANPG